MWPDVPIEEKQYERGDSNMKIDQEENWDQGEEIYAWLMGIFYFNFRESQMSRRILH